MPGPDLDPPTGQVSSLSADRSPTTSNQRAPREETGVGPQEAGALTEGAGAVPEQTGAVPEEARVVPEQTGAVRGRRTPQDVPPREAGAPPQEAGALTEGAGAVPEQTGAVPEEARVVPEQTGAVRGRRTPRDLSPQEAEGLPDEADPPPQAASPREAGVPPREAGAPPEEADPPPRQAGGAREPPDDHDLAQRLALGDLDAFAALYERYAEPIYDFAARFLGDREAAADVTQETFLKTLTALRTAPPPRALRAWLFTVARNAAIDHLRRQRPAAVDPMGNRDHPLSPPPDLHLDPQHAAEQAELRALVWDAARGLNPADRTLLDLSLRHGLSASELAEALGASRGSIHTRLSRLRRALEESVTALLLIRRARDVCPRLAALVAERTPPGGLTPALRRATSRHVAECPTCQDHRRRYATAAELFAGLAPIPLDPGLREVLARRIQDALVATRATRLSEQATASPRPGQPVQEAGVQTPVTAPAARSPGPSGSARILLSVVGSLTLAALLAVALFNGASTHVTLVTADCPPLALRFEGAGDLLARASGLPQILAPGQPARFRLPPGSARAWLTPDSADLRLDGLPVQIRLAVDLARVLWDGRDLLGTTPQDLSLDPSSTHTLQLVCR
jgi:RNA polymerase sigma factor (sigma-70 family)